MQASLTWNTLRRQVLNAHAVPGASFTETIRRFRPHVLIGATSAPGTFNEEVVRLMAEINPRPVIFALSNPTSRAECSAEQVIRWSDGRAVFASGSPFAAVAFQGREYRPGQGNNAYVFPGIGLGAIACGMRTISDEIFLTAAHTLAGMVSPEDLASGAVYQPLTDIRKVSLAIAAAVAEQAWEQGLVRDDRPDDPESLLAGMMYDPVY